MDEEGPLVIKRGGFLSALAYGFFGTVSVAVVCGTALAFYAMYIVDRQVSHVLTASPEIVAELAAWKEALPPALFDAIDDERAPGYAQQLDVQVRLASRDDGLGMVFPVVEVVNRGDRTVSLMGLRILVEDAAGVPVQESNTFAATPLAVDGDWRGPLLPGTRRRLTARPLSPHEHPATAMVEITELRVWGKQADSVRTGAPALMDFDQIDPIPVDAVAAETYQETLSDESDKATGDFGEAFQKPPETDGDAVEEFGHTHEATHEDATPATQAADDDAHSHQEHSHQESSADGSAEGDAALESSATDSTADESPAADAAEEAAAD